MPAAITLRKSASSRMMLADLPPSSCVTRFTVGAAFCATSTPARVEPVNDTMSTSGCLDSAVPTPGPSPFTRLNTPAGTPASCMTSAKMIAFNGAISLGFSTIVQPAARAGATFAAIWLSGQFHGVINAHTPIGSCTMRLRSMSFSHSKAFSVASVVRKCPTPAGACAAFASDNGAPISFETAAASRGCASCRPR